MSSHNTPFSTYSDNPSKLEPSRHEFETLRTEFNIATPEDMSHTSQTDDLLICTACGTQYDIEDRTVLTRCRICDDDRQFVPKTGQAFTTFHDLKTSGNYENKWQRMVQDDENFWSIWTEPQLAIGQRAILIRTPQGNVLWDCIAYLDTATVEWINSLGGLSAIAISHPHYYTTHLEWAETFECPVYLAWEDKEWLNRLDRLGKSRTFIHGMEEEIEIHGKRTGVKLIKPGGHFPGSLVCLAYGRLLIADTLVTSPSGLGDWSKGPAGAKDARPRGMNTYTFMHSIPNQIPLNPEQIVAMWKVLKRYDYHSTHGAFLGMEVFDRGNGEMTSVRQRILDSMQIQIRQMGWVDHAFLKET